MLPILGKHNSRSSFLGEHGSYSPFLREHNSCSPFLGEHGSCSPFLREHNSCSHSQEYGFAAPHSWGSMVLPLPILGGAWFCHFPFLGEHGSAVPINYAPHFLGERNSHSLFLREYNSFSPLLGSMVLLLPSYSLFLGKHHFLLS